VTWLVVYSKATQENKAETNLKNQSFETYLPKYRKEVITSNKIKELIKPLFPRYLFVRITQNSIQKNIGLIRSTFGVSELLKIGEHPLEIKEEIIDSIRLMERDHLQKLDHIFKKGDKVSIKEGPYKNIEAIFLTDDGEKRATILFELIGKETKININKNTLKKINF
tara:strand:- start:1857 stop:2357 length:501 start_codon:yes stop_codon:yes gene_type:complete